MERLDVQPTARCIPAPSQPAGRPLVAETVTARSDQSRERRTGSYLIPTAQRHTLNPVEPKDVVKIFEREMVRHAPDPTRRQPFLQLAERGNGFLEALFVFGREIQLQVVFPPIERAQ